MGAGIVLVGPSETVSRPSVGEASHARGQTRPRTESGCQVNKLEKRAGWLQPLCSRGSCVHSSQVVWAMLQARQVASQYVGHSKTRCQTKRRRAQLKKCEIKPVSDPINQL